MSRQPKDFSDLMQDRDMIPASVESDFWENEKIPFVHQDALAEHSEAYVADIKFGRAMGLSDTATLVRANFLLSERPLKQLTC